MKKLDLRQIIFLALCCSMSLFSKRIISPIANPLGDFLRIPGSSITTAFSLMFLVLAITFVPKFGCGILMGGAQSVLALALGMTGRMGALAPIAYILPGLIADCLQKLLLSLGVPRTERIVLLNLSAAVTASLISNFLMFRLQGTILMLYLCVAAFSGVLFGFLASRIVEHVRFALPIKE